MPTESLDTLVFSLFRSTGGSKMFPSQVTPAGLKRRLARQRALHGREPTWEHPEVHTALVRALASRITDFTLPAVLDAWVGEYQGKERKRLIGALGRALAIEHPDAAKGWFKIPGATAPTTLLERLIRAHGDRLDRWVVAWHWQHVMQPPGFEAWRQWVLVGARARVAQGLPLPGEPDDWATVLRAHQVRIHSSIHPEMSAKACQRAYEVAHLAGRDFRWLVAQRPDLTGASHLDHRGWPVLAAKVGEAEGISMELLLIHPATLQAPVLVTWTKGNTHQNPWLDWINGLPASLHRRPLPVWMVMGLQQHVGVLRLVQQAQTDAFATPAETAQFRNLMALQRTLGWGHWKGEGEEEKIGGPDGRDRQSEAVQQAPCWNHPHTLQAPAGDVPGDTHPLWAAIQREPRLLACRYDHTPFLPGFREAVADQPHRLQACDQDGANLWWAIAGGLATNTDANRDVLGFLAQHGVYCQPDHQGRGLFHRFPYVAHVFRKAQGGDIIQKHHENPFWDSLQKNSDGFFGSTPEGRQATAMALWQDASVRGWYRKEWKDDVKDEVRMLLMAVDGQKPDGFHPVARLLVAMALAKHQRETGHGQDYLALWMPDPEDPAVVPLLTSEFYRDAVAQTPTLEAIGRQRAAEKKAPEHVPRRRLRS